MSHWVTVLAATSVKVFSNTFVVDLSVSTCSLFLMEIFLSITNFRVNIRCVGMSPCWHDNFVMLLTTNKAKTFKSIQRFFFTQSIQEDFSPITYSNE